MKRIITATVIDKSGVFNRFSGVLTRRQVNIDSISVGKTEAPGISRITIIINVRNYPESEQVTKQLNKMIDVIKVSDITDDAHFERELALVKVSAPASIRTEFQAVISPFRASIIDVGVKNVTVQVTGTADKINAFLDVVAPYGVQRIARTGVVGLKRG
jgi:acetolactate synthase-1/3 small subunit